MSAIISVIISSILNKFTNLILFQRRTKELLFLCGKSVSRTTMNIPINKNHFETVCSFVSPKLFNI